MGDRFIMSETQAITDAYTIMHMDMMDSAVRLVGSYPHLSEGEEDKKKKEMMYNLPLATAMALYQGCWGHAVRCCELVVRGEMPEDRYPSDDGDFVRLVERNRPPLPVVYLPSSMFGVITNHPKYVDIQGPDTDPMIGIFKKRISDLGETWGAIGRLRFSSIGYGNDKVLEGCAYLSWFPKERLPLAGGRIRFAWSM